MFPDRANPPTTSSFQFPVAPPPDDAPGDPFQTVQIPCKWLPYVRGALMQLLVQATWKTDDWTTVQNRVFNLIGAFQECGGGPPFECDYDFSTGPSGWQPSISPPWIPTNGAIWSDAIPGWGQTIQVHTDNRYRTQVDIYLFLPVPAYITAYQINYDLHKGSFDITGESSGVVLYDELGNVTYNGQSPSQDWPDGAFELNEELPSPTRAAVIRVIFICSSLDGTEGGGSADITSAIIYGLGSIPPCQEPA